MPTVNQVISDVRQDLNRVSYDGYIPAKFLHSKLLDAARSFIKRSAEDRRLSLYPDIWVTVDSFELCDSDFIQCANIPVPDCRHLMKSVKKLPEIYTTTYGYLLNISSADYSRDYVQTTPKIYNAILSRKFRNPNLRYFWIYNGHLVIPDALVKTVTIRAVFCDKAQGLRLQAEGCDDTDCIQTLDQEFTAPGYLLDDIKSYTVQKIAGVKDKIPTDAYPDLNDNVKVSKFAK